MTRVIPEYSKSAVARASKTVGKGVGSTDDIRDAREVLSNFRSAHAFPLNAVTVTVRKKALAIDSNAVVAQRLKRLPTIIDKLERIPTMSITTMHDLGGCRVVLSNVDEVDLLVQQLESAPRAQNKVTRTYDYIRDNPGPKRSGYRGIHLAYEYRASKEEYHGLRIELQVRTQLQHAWATAVETMDLFSRSELKYSKGDERLKRFFAVASSLMAAKENTALVPNAEQGVESLVAEIRELDEQIDVVSRLQGYASIVGDHATSDRRNALTLELRRSAQELTVSVHERMSDAEDRLATLEALNDDDLDVVLVNIAKIGQLRAAYPNYYADTSMFTQFIDEQVGRN